MATTARELLALAGECAEAMPAGVESAEIAVTALGHVGRALGRMLPLDDHGFTGAPALMVDQLVAACRSAASTWQPREGRLPDLAGAATDLIGRQVEYGATRHTAMRRSSWRRPPADAPK